MSDPDIAAELLTPEGRRDPYRIYAALREAAPAVKSERLRCWIVPRYDDVLAGFGDMRLSSRKFHGYLGGVALSPDEEAALAHIRPFFSDFMVQMDPPAHTRQRGLVNRAFLPRMIDVMRPAIEELVATLLDPLTRRGEIELMAEVAQPLTVRVIMDLIGIAPEGHAYIQGAAEAIAAFLAIVRPSPGDLTALAAKLVEAQHYLRPLIERRRDTPASDLLGQMVKARDRGDMLSEQELIVTVIFLLAAGHETTASLIGNGVSLLLNDEQAWERLRREPSVAPAAVEELLRLESPLQFSGRLAAEDVPVGDVVIPKGSMVRLGLGSANHDPSRFADPDRLDFDRSRAGQHMALGHGIHFCLGAALARLETQCVLLALAERSPRLRALSPEPAWKANYVVRSLERLPLAG